MKNIALFLAIAFLAACCKEKPLIIPDLSIKRKVLVEELTGVRCQNCPDGTRTLTGLQETYGEDNLIAIAIHAAGSFSVPYAESHEDYHTAEAQAMADFIGIPEGFPTASVDRHEVDANTPLFIPRQQWGAVIAEEIEEDPGIGIYIVNNFDAASRQLDIQVNLAPDKTFSEELRLTVVITQDSIVDYQLDGSFKNPNYIHRHILRDVVSQPDGDIITEPMVPGEVVSKNYSVTLPAEWEVKHCRVVAFVHHGGVPDKEVLQVEEAHVE